MPARHGDNVDPVRPPVPLRNCGVSTLDQACEQY